MAQEGRGVNVVSDFPREQRVLGGEDGTVDEHHNDDLDGRPGTVLRKLH